MAVNTVSTKNPANEMERYALMLQQRAMEQKRQQTAAAKPKPVPMPPPTGHPTTRMTTPTSIPSRESSPRNAGTPQPSRPTSGTNLSSAVAGTQPKRDIDLQLALMANDVYSRPGENPAAGNELTKAGWTRLTPENGSYSLTDQNGKPSSINSRLLEDPASGFSTGIYKNDAGQYVVAFAGTNPAQFGDIKADIGQGLGVTTAQYDHAVNLAKKVQDIAGTGNVAFTGHSLGGGLAATAALATHETGVTFNAAGVSNETLRNLGYANPNDTRAQVAAAGTLRSYSVDGDPLTTVSALGAPEQLGTKWHVGITKSGVSVADPRDIGTLHGGSGPGQLYVEGVRSGNAQPGIVTNPTVKAVLDAVPLFGDLMPAQRNAALNLVGNGLNAEKGFRSDLLQIGDRAHSELAGVCRRPDAFSSIRVSGIGADAALDAAGSAASRVSEFGGRTVTALTDGLGTNIRDWGTTFGLDPGSVQATAKAVESSGDGTRDAIDGTGSVVEAVADKGGDAIAWGSSQIANGAKAAVNTVQRDLNPLNWF